MHHLCYFITCIIFISNISFHHYNGLDRNGGFGCNEQFKQQFSKQCKRKRQRQHIKWKKSLTTTQHQFELKGGASIDLKHTQRAHLLEESY